MTPFVAVVAQSTTYRFSVNKFGTSAKRNAGNRYAINSIQMLILYDEQLSFQTSG